MAVVACIFCLFLVLVLVSLMVAFTFTLSFILFSLLLSLGFVCCPFPSYFRFKVRLFISFLFVSWGRLALLWISLLGLLLLCPIYF